MSKLLKFCQGDQIYYVTNIKFSDLVKCSEVAVYKDDESFGYQRHPNPSHYNKIAASFKDKNIPLFPTAILLAGDAETIEPLFSNLEYDFSKSNYIFRIVDGQHRIEGIKKALKDYENNSQNINLMEFCVIIMSIPKGSRIIEVETFCNVNIKAKPIKKDLAYLAQYKIRREENHNPSTKKEDGCFEIGISICRKLNDYLDFPIWHNAYIYDAVQNSKGIVGMKSFIESIEKFYKDEWSDELTTKDIDIIIPNKIIDNLLLPAWKIIHTKFSKCFEKLKKVEMEDDEIFYNLNYNIQKTLGVKVIHKLLYLCFDECEQNYEKTLKMFETKLEHSDISSDSWAVGGKFSGISSEAGFSYIAKNIFNEEIL